MNAPIRFPCPVCQAPLALPISAAGARGPCPHCGATITGPDPASGRPACQVLPPPPAPAPAPAPTPARRAPVILPERPIERPQPALSAIPERPTNGGISTAILVLSCLLTAFIAFAGGYWIGKNAELAGPLPPPSLPAAPPASGTPPPAPMIVEEPPISPPEPIEPPAPASPQEAVLRAFLTAPGWASRILHVLAPERVREAMAAHAAAHGDGPIRFDGISLLQESGSTRIFLVRTAAIPEGFPVVVAGDESGGGWLVDWESFIEFHDDAFRKFADQGAQGQASFHLLLNPVSSKTGDDGVVKYRLNPPMSGRERVARVEDGSSTHARLGEIFEAQSKLDPATYSELVASTGLPLVVAVSKRPTVGGGTKLWIERVEAVGWSPQNAENP